MDANDELMKATAAAEEKEYAEHATQVPSASQETTIEPAAAKDEPTYLKKDHSAYAFANTKPDLSICGKGIFRPNKEDIDATATENIAITPPLPSSYAKAEPQASPASHEKRQALRDSSFMSTSSHGTSSVHGDTPSVVPGASRVYPSNHSGQADEQSEPSQDFVYAETLVHSGLPANHGADYDDALFGAEDGHGQIFLGIVVTPENDIDVFTGIPANSYEMLESVPAEPVKGVYIKRRRFVGLLIIVLVVVFAAIGLAIGLYVRKQVTAEQPASSTFSLPPTITRFALGLPDYTREAIRNELPAVDRDSNWFNDDDWMSESFRPLSAQGKAWKWLVSDTKLSARSLDDMTRRFALSTLFYATDGPNWTNKTNWLSVTDDVCTWWWESRGAIVLDPAKGTYEESCRSSGLSQLVLLNNGLDGSIPPELALLSGLNIVKLSSNSLQGEIPEVVWRSWQSATAIWLNNNQFTGTIPSTVGLMRTAGTLWFDFNLFSGRLPTQIGRVTNLLYLMAANNLLTGPIPTEISRLKALREILIPNNGVSGSISTEIGRLPKLQLLDLANNHLSGIIPSQMGSAKSLISVNLAGNGLLHGSIPTEFGRLLKMNALYLNNNMLTGTLPTQLGKVVDLFNLDVSKNQLSGTVPTEMDRLLRLTNLRIMNTEMSGSIPASMCQMFSSHQAGRSIIIDCDKVGCDCNCSCG